MFVLGLVLGPLIGLLAGDLLARFRGVEPRVSVSAVVLLLFLVVISGVLNLELKLGLAVGVLLGLLLVHSPMALPGSFEGQSLPPINNPPTSTTTRHQR